LHLSRKLSRRKKIKTEAELMSKLAEEQGDLKTAA